MGIILEEISHFLRRRSQKKWLTSLRVFQGGHQENLRLCEQHREKQSRECWKRESFVVGDYEEHDKAIFS